MNVLRKLETLIHEEEMQMDDKEHVAYEAKLNNNGDDEKTAYRTMFCQWTAIDTTKTEAATGLSEWFKQNREYSLDCTNNKVPTPMDCEAFIDVGFVKLKSVHQHSPYALAFQKIKL